MRRWIVLLAVMELAVLAIYVPTLRNFGRPLPPERVRAAASQPGRAGAGGGEEGRTAARLAGDSAWRINLAAVLYPELLGPTEPEFKAAVESADEELKSARLARERYEWKEQAWRDSLDRGMGLLPMSQTARPVTRPDTGKMPGPLAPRSAVRLPADLARERHRTWARVYAAEQAFREASTATSMDVSRAERTTVALAAYAVLTACWLVAMFWLARCGGQLDRRTLIAVLIGAGVLAVSLWGLPPTFSNDSYRYRWDGLAAANGFNPYEIKPDSLWQFKELDYPRLYFQTRDWSWRASVYPAFGLMVFVANAMLGNTMLGWRMMLGAAEVLLAIAGWQVLRRRGLPAGWLAALLLCPLLIFETHLDGHLELVAVALVVAGFAALTARKWAASAVLLALAVNIKYLWPGLAALLLARRLARQRKLLAGGAVFATSLLVCWLPFMVLDWSSPPARDAFNPVPHWLPLPLKQVVRAPRDFLEIWNSNATLYRMLAVRCDPESAVPKLVALGAVLAGAGALVLRRRWWLDMEDIVLLLAVALIFAPLAFPWYYLWLLPGVLVFGPGPPWTPRFGPPVWAVLALAAAPAMHEFWPSCFGGGVATPLPAVPWMIVAAIVPPLIYAWSRRLARPTFTAPGITPTAGCAWRTRSPAGRG